MNGKIDVQLALKMAVLLGVALMENGAEIYRVEESVYRVLKAYGIRRTDVYALPNMLIVTIETSDELSYTKTRRIYHRSPNFERVKRLNDFARRLSVKPLPLDEAFAMLEKIENSRFYSLPINWGAYMLAAAAFVLMLGGSLGDTAVAAVCAFVGRLACVPMERYHANSFLTTVVASFLHNVVAFSFSQIFITLQFNVIITGTLMLLFPGVAFMTAIRDVIAKDLSAGMIEGLEAVVVAGAIAVGSAMAYSCFPVVMEVIAWFI